MTNQSDRQADARSSTGTALTYEGDSLAYFDSQSVAAGEYNGRLLAWINQALGTSYTEINGAKTALANNISIPTWDGLNLLGSVGTRQPTYYVDGVSGSDSNNGKTPATAWQTIAKVNAATFVVGDIIGFKGGQTFVGTINPLPANSNLAYDSYTITSYGSGVATIAPSSAQGIIFYAISGWTAKNINVAGTGTTAQGIYLGADVSGRRGYMKVINCGVSGVATAYGILIAGDSGTNGFDHVQINNCLVSGIAGMGICSYGSGSTSTTSHTDVTIQNCIVHDTGSGGIVTGRINTGVVQNCVAYKTGLTVNAQFGMWMSDCRSMVFQNCESYANTTPGVDGGGFDIDGGCQNCTIQYCYSHDNAGAGYMQYVYAGATIPNSGNVVRFCLSVNDALTNETALVFGVNSATNSGVFYNNTVYCSSSACIGWTVSDACTVQFYNNVLIAAGPASLISVSTGVATQTYTGNAYFAASGNFKITYNGTTYTSFAAWQTASGQEKVTGTNVAVVGDPMLVFPSGNDAASQQLISGSPALSAGLNLNALFGINPGTRDYFGNPITLPTNMGAYSGAGVAASSVPWKPTHLPAGALAAWWDASDTNRITFSGGKVASWRDRASGILASQGTGANQPGWSATGLNGMPALSFNGSQGLTFPATLLPTGSAVSTLIASGQGGGGAGVNQTMVYWGTVAANNARILGYNNDSALHTWLSTATTIDQSSTSLWTADHLVIGQFDSTGGASTVVSQYIDGTLSANGTVAAVPATTGSTGAIGTLNQTVSSGNLTGSIQDIPILAIIPSTSQRQKIEGEESWSNGLAGSNLPGGHPYKSRAPLYSDP